MRKEGKLSEVIDEGGKLSSVIDLIPTLLVLMIAINAGYNV